MMVEEATEQFKLYLTYQYKLNDDEVLQALRRFLHESGALTTVHPEMMRYRQQSGRLYRRRANCAAPSCLSRSLECEAEAIARMINSGQ